MQAVLDFRSLNKNIVSLPGEMPACEAKLREWRRADTNCSVVDLKWAYLQIFVAKEFWAYQTVHWKGQVYLLTRFGFGLNVAPKIMTAIVQKVLDVNKKLKASATSYLDNILVMGERTEIEEAREHLRQYGLQTKEAEQVGCAKGVRILGLRVDENLSWSRDSKLPVVSTDCLTWRELHSWLGELVSHYPVVGWLHAACWFL